MRHPWPHKDSKQYVASGEGRFCRLILICNLKISNKLSWKFASSRPGPALNPGLFPVSSNLSLFRPLAYSPANPPLSNTSSFRSSLEQPPCQAGRRLWALRSGCRGATIYFFTSLSESRKRVTSGVGSFVLVTATT